MAESYSASKFSIPAGAITRKSILTSENRNLIRAMKKASREMAERGLAKPEDGELSARDGDAFLITAAQSNPLRLSDEDFVLVEGFDTSANTLRKASGLKQPSPETPMHALIYMKRPDVRAILHICDRALARPGVAEKLKLPATAANLAPGAKESAEAIAEAAASGDFIVLPGRGAVALGRSVEECVEKADVFHRRGSSSKL